MDFNRKTADADDPLLDSLAADLADAAYPVALRHGPDASWIDLELDLWKALTRTIQQWRPVLRSEVKVVPAQSALGAAGSAPL